MITGSIVALVTPMLPDGNVDWAALDNLVEWHIQEGTHAIVAVGTTGESATLTVEEHLAVIERIIKKADRRIPIIAGTGANATQEALALTRAAEKLGADAALLVTPYYNKPTQEGLYQHYKLIAESVSIPIILYNVPGRTGVDMQNATVARLAGVGSIVGIKDATGNLERGKELLSLVADKMAVYSGDDATAVDFILLGAKGNISVTANVAPKSMSQACAAALAGDVETAKAWNHPLQALHRDLFIESNPIPVKWALSAMGRIDTGIRLPLTALSVTAHEPLILAMKSAGVV